MTPIGDSLDHIEPYSQWHTVGCDNCAKLTAQRDEALAALEKIYPWLERAKDMAELCDEEWAGYETEIETFDAMDKDVRTTIDKIRREM